jgi:hypothetical protein
MYIILPSKYTYYVLPTQLSYTSIHIHTHTHIRANDNINYFASKFNKHISYMVNYISLVIYLHITILNSKIIFFNY